MGSDPAPFSANLFLFHYESEWLRNIKKTDQRRTRKFGNVFRFIDDLVAINDGLEFSKSYSEIYPTELELKRENADINKASFLDLEVNIVVLSAEILRICRATSTYAEFLNSSNILINRIKRQGANIDGIQKVLFKMLSRHKSDLKKFYVESGIILMNLLRSGT